MAPYSRYTSKGRKSLQTVGPVGGISVNLKRTAIGAAVQNGFLQRTPTSPRASLSLSLSLPLPPSLPLHPMAAKKMHAVVYDRYGGGASALKHVDVPVPHPKKEEILIKLEAASINPFDWKVQKGMLRPFLPRRFPLVPVLDVSGEVVEVGLGVSKLKVGDKVVALLNVMTGGGFAEYAVTMENLTVKRPPEVSAAEAAGLPAAGLSALQALIKSAGVRLDGSGEQSNILITAASGGVGHYAVQLAKLGNHHITATCGTRNIDFIKRLGADEVLDYKTPEGSALKSPSRRKFDVVIHCATGIPWSTFEPNLSENGMVIDLTPTFGVMIKSVLSKLTFPKKKLVPFMLYPKHEDLEYLIGLMKDGKLKTTIDSRHPLSKAENAWAKSIEGHATGKIIVEHGK